MLRGLLGTSRTTRLLVGDVNTRAIPRLVGNFRVDETTMIGGAAPKVLIVFDGTSESYIAKAPSKKNATACECVTEHLICSLGRMLPLKVAQSRLAILPPRRSCSTVPDVRFMSRVFLRQAERLRHGIELVAESLGLDRAEVEREIPPRGAEERQFYTVDLVADVLKQIARTTSEYESLRDSFARMLAFDALVGTNDRHSENWGVIENVLNRTEPLRFAPIYDTARALFWQHSDAQLVEKIGDGANGRKQMIENYANRSPVATLSATSTVVPVTASVRSNIFRTSGSSSTTSSVGGRDSDTFEKAAVGFITQLPGGGRTSPAASRRRAQRSSHVRPQAAGDRRHWRAQCSAANRAGRVAVRCASAWPLADARGLPDKTGLRCIKTRLRRLDRHPVDGRRPRNHDARRKSDDA